MTVSRSVTWTADASAEVAKEARISREAAGLLRRVAFEIVAMGFSLRSKRHGSFLDGGIAQEP
jgi:hypothetical protein